MDFENENITRNKHSSEILDLDDLRKITLSDYKVKVDLVNEDNDIGTERNKEIDINYQILGNTENNISNSQNINKNIDGYVNRQPRFKGGKTPLRRIFTLDPTAIITSKNNISDTNLLGVGDNYDNSLNSNVKRNRALTNTPDKIITDKINEEEDKLVKLCVFRSLKKKIPMINLNTLTPGVNYNENIENNKLIVFPKSQAGKNSLRKTKINQDAYISIQNIFGLENFHLFGVLDGHGKFSICL